MWCARVGGDAATRVLGTIYTNYRGRERSDLWAYLQSDHHSSTLKLSKAPVHLLRSPNVALCYARELWWGRLKSRLLVNIK
jgi:hypothetical protein